MPTKTFSYKSEARKWITDQVRAMLSKKYAKTANIRVKLSTSAERNKWIAEVTVFYGD